jgi:hypothetical protein
MCCSVLNRSWFHRVVRISGIMVASVGALVGAGSSTRGDGARYDSSKCARDPRGMIYIAAGRHVYHQPFENLKYVHGVSLETAGLPMPPQPWQPKGCPDHPLRGTGFKFSPFSDVSSPESATATVGGVIQLLEIDSSSWWDTHERYSLASHGSCAAEPSSGTEPAPALTMCWPVAADSADRRSRAPFAATVDPQQYASPLGQPLAILCNPDLSGDVDGYACEISYRLDQDVGVWYEFRTSRIPLSGVISFDRELRRRIAEAEVPDYGWPVLPSGRPLAPRQ